MENIFDRGSSEPTESETVVGACGQQYGADMVAVAQACGFGPAAPCRQGVLGAPRTTLNTSTDTTVTITVSLRGGSTFIGRKIVLPALWAANVRIKEVWCDATNIMPSNDPLPGELFSSDNPDSPELPFVPLGQNSTIKVVFTEEAGAWINSAFGIMGLVTDAPVGQCQDQNSAAYQAIAQACGFGPGSPCKRTVLGSPATTLTSASGLGVDTTITITVSLRGGRTFIGRRLVLPKEVAQYVAVKEVWCDAENILQSNDPIAGQVFASNAQIVPMPELAFKPVSQNSTIRIVLTNMTGAALANTVVAIDGTVI